MFVFGSSAEPFDRQSRPKLKHAEPDQTRFARREQLAHTNARHLQMSRWLLSHQLLLFIQRPDQRSTEMQQRLNRWMNSVLSLVNKALKLFQSGQTLQREPEQGPWTCTQYKDNLTTHTSKFPAPQKNSLHIHRRNMFLLLVLIFVF